MVGHNLCFYGKIWNIIPKLSLFSLLILSTVLFIVCMLHCKLAFGDIPIPRLIRFYSYFEMNFIIIVEQQYL